MGKKRDKGVLPKNKKRWHHKTKRGKKVKREDVDHSLSEMTPGDPEQPNIMRFGSTILRHH